MYVCVCRALLVQSGKHDIPAYVMLAAVTSTAKPLGHRNTLALALALLLVDLEYDAEIRMYTNLLWHSVAMSDYHSW